VAGKSSEGADSTPGENLEEIVYRTLKGAIIGHRLSPGAPLAEAEVAEALKVSRTPVRSAFRRLADEGLVTWRRRKGATVAHATAGEIKDVFYVRRLLEAASAELAAGKATPRDIEELEGYVALEVEAFRRKDVEGVLAAGRRFHDAVGRMSGNSVLASMISIVVAKSYVHLIFYDAFDSPEPRSPGEHRRIIEALRKGDAEEARRAMEAHVRSSEDYLDLALYLRPRDVASALSGDGRAEREV
jgi:DNA-binding GntR family transcriptional regulator